MRILLVGLAIAALGAGHAGAAPRKPERPAAAPRAPAVVVEPVQGDKGTAASRAALREAIARHVQRQGFHVVDGGKGVTYRLRPTVLALDAGVQGGGAVEVKASLVAVDRKGRVAAMVEGGARAQGAAPGRQAAVVEAQAIEAAARSIAEDLGRRLLEAR